MDTSPGDPEGATGEPRALTQTVIVITWKRPEALDRCLASLAAQESAVDEVIVVDASPTDKVRRSVEIRYGFVYVEFPGGAGHMTAARNIGLLHASGDIISFLDDDTVADASWSRALREGFAVPCVDAIAGRTTNSPFEGAMPDPNAPIGGLTHRGRLIANFEATPALPLAVTHGIGANMTFRRSIVAELGGFYPNWPGTAMREDTDMFLRVHRAGGGVVFDPAAAVLHIPEPHVKGKRFDHRYTYFAERNHISLLTRHYGLRGGITLRWLRDLPARCAECRGRDLARTSARRLVLVAGCLTGVVEALTARRLKPVDPVMHGPQPDSIRLRLSR